MCCRISTTGFATRTIAGLYIFLATFLIGFFAVRVTSAVFPATDAGSVTITKATEIVRATEDNNGCQNKDGVRITRSFDFAAPGDFSKARIAVSNRGQFAITYAKADIFPYSGIGGYVTDLLPSPPINQPMKVLKPQEQYVDFTESKDGRSSFRITFWYRINNDSTWRFMTAYFPEGNAKPSDCRTLAFRP